MSSSVASIKLVLNSKHNVIECFESLFSSALLRMDSHCPTSYRALAKGIDGHVSLLSSQMCIRY